jgi:hypothetical protein
LCRFQLPGKPKFGDLSRLSHEETGQNRTSTSIPGLTQPTISHHLEILVDAGIFTRDKRGVWAYYALVPAAMDALSAHLAGDVLLAPRQQPASYREDGHQYQALGTYQTVECTTAH